MADAEENGENFQEDSVTDFDADAQQFDGGEGDATTTANDESAVEDPELEAIKARVKEMEEEAEKLKELQNAADKAMNMTSPTSQSANAFPSLEEKVETDGRSVCVQNVDYGATAEELEQHFHGCGSVNRVTILCDKFTGHPKGFAYVEFADKDSTTTAMALDDSLFRGRQIKVTLKRTNRPGITTTNRHPRGRSRRPSYRQMYGGFAPRRPRFSRYRRASFFSPY